MGKLIYKGVKIALVCLMCLVLLIFGIFMFKKLVLKQTTPVIFGYSIYIVESGSMEPEMYIGDLILVKKRKADYYEEGMVITFKTELDSIPTTHKIIERDGDIITTRGTNKETNTTNDEPFHVDNVLGEVVGVWNGFAKSMTFIGSPVGICLFLGGLFGIFGIFYLLDKVILKEERKTDK